jgi:hypothetical protein
VKSRCILSIGRPCGGSEETGIYYQMQLPNYFGFCSSIACQAALFAAIDFLDGGGGFAAATILHHICDDGLTALIDVHMLNTDDL